MRWALICLWLSGASCAQAACVVRERASVALDIVGGTILAPVRINGMAATMVLDTGASRSVVTKAAVARLGLALDEWVATTMRGVGGVERHRNANPKSFTFGGIPLQRRTLTKDTSLTVGTIPASSPAASAANSPAASAANRAIDGLLGRDFLSLFDLALDMPGQNVTLYEVAGCAGRFLPWTGGYSAIQAENPMDSALVLPVDIDGKRLRALLDTGASASLVAAPGMFRLGLTEASIAANPGQETGGLGPRTVTMRRQRFTSFSAGTEALTDPVIWVAPIRLNPIVDMLLGADWLAGRTVWISFATRQVFIAAR